MYCLIILSKPNYHDSRLERGERYPIQYEARGVPAHDASKCHRADSALPGLPSVAREGQEEDCSKHVERASEYRPGPRWQVHIVQHQQDRFEHACEYLIYTVS